LSEVNFKSIDEVLELTQENIEIVLKDIRPFLQLDGGDVEFSGILDSGIVEVRFKGSCKECPLSPMTLRAGIERILMQKIPAIKRIESVE